MSFQERRGVSPGRVKWLCEKLDPKLDGCDGQSSHCFYGADGGAKGERMQSCLQFKSCSNRSKCLYTKVKTKQRPICSGAKKERPLLGENVSELLVLHHCAYSPKLTKGNKLRWKSCLCFIIKVESACFLLAESSENQFCKRWCNQHELMMQRTADVWSETRSAAFSPLYFNSKIPLWEFLDIFYFFFAACAFSDIRTCSLAAHWTLSDTLGYNLPINLCWIPHADASPAWINMFV